VPNHAIKEYSSALFNRNVCHCAMNAVPNVTSIEVAAHSVIAIRASEVAVVLSAHIARSA
jgi:hypothetical protein